MEKCSVCKQTITDRMLKATGNSYHPQCFTCVMCHTPLEGASFIVDQANQPHCVDDYHRYGEPAKTFAHLNFLAMCCSSAVTAVPQQRETCVECHRGGHGLLRGFVCCRKYAPRCSVCSEPIMPEPGKDETVRVVALEKNFHMKCYKCEVSRRGGPAPRVSPVPIASSRAPLLSLLSEH